MGGVTAFTARSLRLTWLGSCWAGRLAQEYLQQLWGAHKRWWPVRFADAIPIYGCLRVLFTGALLHMLPWLLPAPGMSDGVLCVQTGQLLFSIAQERGW